jgi:secreted trypsin-like serine protease
MPDSSAAARPDDSSHGRPTNWRVARLAGAAVAALTVVGLTAAPAVAAPSKIAKPVPSVRPSHVPTAAKSRAVGIPAPAALPVSAKRPGPESTRNGPNGRIVGGAPASIGEYPYFVSLQSSTGGTGDFFCGGSLMSTTKVLTAAHCVNGDSAAGLQVVIGGTTLSGSDVGVVRNVSAVNVDPAFDPSRLTNDVAILTLATPITRADTTVQWLRLAQGNELGLVDPGDTSTVIGHGTTSFGGPTSNQLLEVAVPIQSDATMSAPSRYGSLFDGPTMVGAGPLAGGQDSCQGDSGGPLLITSTPQDIQIGDVSWGFGCAQPDLPGVYGELYQGNMATFVNGQVSRPGNDRFGSPTVLSGNAGSVTGTNENATLDPGESGAEASVWYSWTPTESGNAQLAVNQHGYDSQVDVFTGSSVSALTAIASNDDANGSLQSEVEFNAVANTTYRIRVDGFAFDYGSHRLSYAVNRPANDDFAAATALTGAVSSAIAATNTRATGQAGEPAPVFGAADASLWYSWTASASGTARFTTAGSSYDTTLAVYTGSALTGLTNVATNDDDNNTLQSLVSFPVTAGTTYRVQVGGFAGSRGTGRLQFSLNPETNDMFAAATTLSGAAGTIHGSNLRATNEPGEPVLGFAPQATVWYRWSAPNSGTFQFTTVGSNFDTVLAAATGSSITSLTQVAFNDDSIGVQSKIQFAATAGTTYRIRVDGFAGQRGSIQLNWTQI